MTIPLILTELQEATTALIDMEECLLQLTSGLGL